MEFPRQEYWSGVLFPSPGDLPDSGIECMSPALQADSLPEDTEMDTTIPVLECQTRGDEHRLGRQMFSFQIAAVPFTSFKALKLVLRF